MEVRFFKKSERQLMLDSIDRLWRHDHVYVRKPEVLEHLVLNTPYREEFAGADNYSFVGMWDGDRVVGLLGLIPQRFNVFGETHLSMTPSIWITDRNYHKKINGLKMYGIEPATRVMAQVTLGTSETRRFITRNLGWYVFEDFPRWIAVVNKEDTIKHLLPKDSNVIAYLPVAEPVSFTSERYKASESFDADEWDRFYHEKFAPLMIGTARDSEFLNWRYGQSPVLKYNFITVNDSEGHCHGLAVIRIEKISGGAFAIGRILEFIAVEAEASVVLANAVINFEPNVLMWDFYCLSGITAFGFESVGFRRLPAWMDQVMMPTRFQPVDYEVMHITGDIYLDDSIKQRCNIADTAQWYITKGDADQDRAN